MSDWQPIETAPKDETKILAFGEEGYAVIYWLNGLDAWSNGDNTLDSDRWTHWMPLPLGPPRR